MWGKGWRGVGPPRWGFFDGVRWHPLPRARAMRLLRPEFLVFGFQSERGRTERKSEAGKRRAAGRTSPSGSTDRGRHPFPIPRPFDLTYRYRPFRTAEWKPETQAHRSHGARICEHGAHVQGSM
jgi:hypothetical protein